MKLLYLVILKYFGSTCSSKVFFWWTLKDEGPCPHDTICAKPFSGASFNMQNSLVGKSNSSEQVHDDKEDAAVASPLLLPGSLELEVTSRSNGVKHAE